jgi:hypothetical protein
MLSSVRRRASARHFFAGESRAAPIAGQAGLRLGIEENTMRTTLTTIAV